MSLLQRPPLPKPPPKALPQGLPPKHHPAQPAQPTARMTQPAPAPSPAQPMQMAAAKPAAPAPAVLAHTAQPMPPVRPMSTPMADLQGMSPNMIAMMEAVQIYEALLEEENAMLRTGNADGVAALLDRKMNATRLYQERQRTVLGDPEATRSLTPERRAQVVAQVRALEELARENTILLKANMSAIEQLFEVINNAARKMRKREVSYSEAGVIRDYHVAHHSSLAYNHTV
jgi:hypothetical protein